MDHHPAARLAWLLPRRGVVALDGAESKNFLQGLVTNDVTRATSGSAVYAALLTPQGKYLFDFFVLGRDGGLLLEVALDDAPALVSKLSQYRLRAKIAITDLSANWRVAAIPGAVMSLPASVLSFADPRLAAMGFRMLLPEPGAQGLLEAAGHTVAGEIGYDAHRIAMGVPEGPMDFTREGSFILECNGEELHAVDFKKGCYVGQELTARMKHRATARKRICPVTFMGAPPSPGTPILEGLREVGTVLSSAGTRALASIRLDRMAENGTAITAGGTAGEIEMPPYPLILD